jgi:hypothetical protein
LTGNALWHFVEGYAAFYPSWPDGLSDEDEDLIAEFLDDLRDWNDVAGDSYKTSREAARAIGEHVKRLAKAGLFVGARKRHCLLAGGVQEPSSWVVVDIEIQRIREAELVDADGKPIFSDDNPQSGVDAQGD